MPLGATLTSAPRTSKLEKWKCWESGSSANFAYLAHSPTPPGARVRTVEALPSQS